MNNIGRERFTEEKTGAMFIVVIDWRMIGIQNT
jgi:hypothetical protein